MATVQVDAARLVDALEPTLGFRELTAFLKERSVTAPKGWDDLREKLQAGGEIAAVLSPILVSLAANVILGGQKSATIFELSDEEAAAIFAEAQTLHTGLQSPYRARYPLPLSETELGACGPEHHLVDVLRRENGDVSLVLCSKRLAEERQSYDASEVTAAVQQAFQGYQRFIALKTMAYQTFDVVNLRRRLKRVEVLVDKPTKMVPPETVEERCLTILASLSGALPTLLPLQQANSPLNLFPCIAGLYGNAREGRVTLLQFRSPTKSIKREAMTSVEDLRSEPFHKAGVAAVGTITLGCCRFQRHLVKVEKEAGGDP